MEIRPKSQAELNSQAMAFAGYEVSDSNERDAVSEMAARDIGSVAAHELYPQYVDFLREKRGKRHELLSGRTDLQNKYINEFKQMVDNLHESLPEGQAVAQHEAFIGSGGTADVFVINKDQKEYVVRTLRDEPSYRSPTMIIDQYVAGALPVKGIPHFEQMVAVSYDDKVTVAERMPGETPNELTVDTIDGITETQLQDLLITLRIAQDSDIKIDPHSGNFLYDKDAGFGLIDFDSVDFYGVYEGQDFGDKVSQVVTMLTEAGKRHEQYDSTEYTEARLRLLRKFGSVVRRTDLGEGDHWRVSLAFDSEISRLRLTMGDTYESIASDKEPVPTPPVATDKEQKREWQVPKAPEGIAF